MGERLRVGRLIAALALLVPLSAEAGNLDEDLTTVRAQITSGEHKEALKSLKLIEKSLDESDSLVSNRSLARVWFYKGTAEFGTGNKKGRAEDAWRQALTVRNDFAWDADLMGDSDLISLFEALRGEVEGRGYLETGVPEKVGAAVLYVDGEQHGPEESVIRGTHLAQIACPDEQGTFSVVTDFAKPVDWFALCPDGVDTSVVVAVAEEDEWSEFGPSFGDSDPVEETDPVAEVDPTSAVTDPAVTDPAVTDPAITDPGNSRSGPGLGTYMLASGGALVAGGLVVNFAMVNPAYAEITAANDDPYTVTRAEASDLTTRFNTSRILTIGLTAGGLALAGSSFLIDAPVRPVIGLGHLGVAGRF
ncbi:MAG: hypothetical protein ACI8RZ_000225 [Myxococcota bacterium]|jgi:hypothetical protein